MKKCTEKLIATCLTTTFVVGSMLPTAALANENNKDLIAVPNVLSTEYVESISSRMAMQLSLDQLEAAIPLATTDESATVLFNELVDRYEKMGNTRAVMGNYLSISSVTSSAEKITVNYRIIAKVPSGASLKLGYEYPAVAKTEGGFINLSSKNPGVYNHTFTTKKLNCQVRAYSQLDARTYQEKNNLKTFSMYPTTTKTQYHTVTASNVTKEIVITALPGIIYKLNPTLKTIGFAATLSGGYQAILNMGNSYSVSYVPPAIAVGQYYQIKTYYKNDRVYIDKKIWTSKETYDKGVNPIFTGSYSAPLAKF